MKCSQTKRRISFLRLIVVFCTPLLILILNQCSEYQTEPKQIPKEAETLILPKSMESGLLSTGSTYFISAPELYTDLIIYAHGYYSPEEDPWKPEDDEIEGIPFWKIANSQHFSYATTSYPFPGLNVPEAILDLVALLDFFESLEILPMVILILVPM